MSYYSYLIKNKKLPKLRGVASLANVLAPLGAVRLLGSDDEQILDDINQARKDFIPAHRKLRKDISSSDKENNIE